MELSPFQQVEHLLKEKQNILLCTHAKMDGDALGSIISMALFLKKMGKDVMAVSSDPVPEALAFLPIDNIISTEFSGTRDFIVTLDCENASIDKLKYAVEDNKVNIIVTPKKGQFAEKDISFQKGDVKYDLIIVMDTPDLQQLGSIYHDNTEMFYDIPVLNIDHHASNNRYGHVQVIDPTASSTTEILFELFKHLQKKEQFIDSDIATLLLAGIITDTGSFQNANTTPKSLEISADLLDLGADQQGIIRHIYKTKNLTTLKLWGKVLSKLQIDQTHRIVWSSISQRDLKSTQANLTEASNIIDELMSNAPGAEIILLFREEEEEGLISCSMRTTDPNVNASKIASLFGGGGHRQAAGFKLRGQKNFDEAISKAVEKMRDFQKERLKDTLGNTFDIPMVGQQENKESEVLPIAESADTKQLSAKEKLQASGLLPGNVQSPAPSQEAKKDDKTTAKQDPKQAKPQPAQKPRQHKPSQHKPKKGIDIVDKLTDEDKPKDEPKKDS